MQNERSGWAAAVGTKYVLNNGLVAVIARYTVVMSSDGKAVHEIIEGQLETDSVNAQYSITWDQHGTCANQGANVPGHAGPQGGYDLQRAIRGGEK